MKQIVVISGKGGTGKTTVTASLADLAARETRLVLADADVDAANLELLMQSERISQNPFMSGKTAIIDQESCTACGRCAEVCRFDAVCFSEEKYSIDAMLCEGCLSCLYQCPEDAISSEVRESGEWYQSNSSFGTLFHARLKPGEENSGKLVTEIIEHARDYASAHDSGILLVDGPPGIGCPVTAAIRSADLAILVSEATISGKHDLQRALQLTRYFKLPVKLVINKANLNESMRQEIISLAQNQDIEILGEIPYDESAMEALFEAKPITQLDQHPLQQALEQIWLRLRAYT